MRIAISGVNRGIGEAVSRAALDRGDLILGLGRKPPSWAKDGRMQLSFLTCDMSDHSQLEEACSSFQEPIDALICNAATFGNDCWTADSFSPAALADAFAINTMAPLIMARAFKDNLERGARRLILMMSTGNASLEGNTGGTMLGYRLSKSALNQGVRNLAAEWGPQGFTTVALNPGWVRTDMGGPNAEISADRAATQILHFIDEVSDTTPVNGCFVNPDGSLLPW